METAYAARASIARPTQVDFERSSLGYLRYEMISRILGPRERLDGGVL